MRHRELEAEVGSTVSINAATTEAPSAEGRSDATVVPGPPIRLGRKNLMLDTSWQEMANCLGVDPDLFFPERGASTREAKEVCRGCVVRHDCLEFALANGEKFGIWGGMSERERRRIRRQRALERAAATTPVALAGESA
jgi:WhiB family redox-sensing transcriptional regulator